MHALPYALVAIILAFIFFGPRPVETWFILVLAVAFGWMAVDRYFWP